MSLRTVRSRLLIVVALAVPSFFASETRASAAPILIISGTELMGAQNVDVGGTFYDVLFLDGTCVALFSGCDSPSDFTFTTPGSAMLAGRALLEQVFLDGPSGAFDSDPALTHGCGDTQGCFVWTPYSGDGINMPVLIIDNSPSGFDQESLGGLGPALVDLSQSSRSVFAQWTPSPTAVPEPTSLLLLGTGIAGVLTRARSRRKRSEAD